MDSGKPILAVTAGDFNGIGPEVTLRSIRHPAVRRACRPVLVGPAEVFEVYAKRLRLSLSFEPFDISRGERRATPVIETSPVARDAIRPGRISKTAGIAAVAAIESAVKAVQAGIAHAVVTAPVSKQALHLASVRYPGQTEMVQKLSGSPRVAMMLVSETMRVGLVTIHVPVRRIARLLSQALVLEQIGVVHAALQQDWRIRSPRLAVLGLNPHASEGGDIGDEDVTIVGPAVQRCRRRGWKVEGPFPADAFFGRYRPGVYDAVVAMYHDQGLIPLKMSSFGTGVNISVGMRIVRTSPDHGTAFDIAGKGVANPGSMRHALILAAVVAKNRGLVRGKRP